MRLDGDGLRSAARQIRLRQGLGEGMNTSPWGRVRVLPHSFFSRGADLLGSLSAILERFDLFCPSGPHRRTTVAGQGWLAGQKKKWLPRPRCALSRRLWIRVMSV